MEVVHWELPPIGWAILNADGTTKGNPRPAGAGGVTRNDKGEWHGGFSEKLGRCSSMKAEIRAVLQGLKLAKRLGVRKLWLQLDSIVVTGMLKGTMDWRPEHTSLLQQCKTLITDSDWEVHISHCYREANKVTDRLANMGIGIETGIIFYQSPPMEIKDVLFADMRSVNWRQHGRF